MISDYFTDKITVVRMTDLNPAFPDYSVSGEATVYDARVTEKFMSVRGVDGEMKDAQFIIRLSNTADVQLTDKIVLGDVSSSVVSGNVNITDFQWSPISITNAKEFVEHHKKVIV